MSHVISAIAEVGRTLDANLEAFNLTKQTFLFSLETHYPTLLFPSEMTQLDQVSGFQTLLNLGTFTQRYLV